MLIEAGKTTIEYLSVSFHDKVDARNETCKVSKRSTNRRRKIYLLQECIKFCLEPVSDIASRGQVRTTTDGRKKGFYFLLVSYDADIPKYVDPSRLQKGAQRVGLCYLCLIKREKLSVGRLCSKRTLAESLKLLSEVDGNGRTVDEAKKAVMDYSMYPLPLALAKFPFLDTQGSVEIYAIFLVEAMDTLSLENGRLIEQCVVDMLSDSA